MRGARDLALALGGRWHGSYGLTFCPAHLNTRTPALSLSDGADGRLLAHCHSGCSFTAILDALRGLGLMEGSGTSSPPDPAEQSRRRAKDAAETAKRAAQAARVWDDAQPIAGTAAETYLRGRGITWPLPLSLRFAPSCWHVTARRLPAMIAMVEGAGGAAVHRTYLRADGAGKADVTQAKMMLGRCAGGAVRLSDGLGPLVVAEGIETALSLQHGLEGDPARIWAALSTAGMAGLSLPDVPGDLIVAPDGDMAGLKAAHILAERAAALGWDVAFLPAPEGLDWNDVLTMRGGAA